jgi:hypothetical protein
MNAGPADTHSPHLDLTDLIAGVTGQAVADQAREHLASCEHCQLEANRWNLVADGVRDLAPAAPAPAPAASPRRGRLRLLAGPRRRVTLVAASAAAAIVLLAGVGIGVGAVHIRVGGSGASKTVLTAVTGCDMLKQADGTLEQVNGASLILKTPSGQPVTVTTTASTFVSTSGALLSDITDGASVMVRGHSSGGTIAAAIVTVGQPFSAVSPAGFVPVRGTVSDVSTTGFTLVTSGGTRIPVTTSSGTLVVIPHASLSQLPAGVVIFAVGRAGPDGTLSAQAVAAIRQLPPGNPQLHVHLKDCSAASIDNALASMG